MKKNLRLIFIFLFCSKAAFAQNSIKAEIDAFSARTGSTTTIDKATNSISFIRFSPTRAYQVDGVDAQQKSSNFLSINPRIFGLRANRDAFRFREQKTDNHGLAHVTLQQTYNGVPVFDGMYKFHYNKSNELTALNGNFISDIKVNTAPTLAQHEAEELAIKYVQGGKIENPETSSLKVNKSSLYIFQKGLAQGYNGPKSLVYEVEVRNGVDVREFLYIDAHSGALVEQFTGIHQAMHRTLYETSILPANKKWDEGDVLPGTLDQWQQSEVETSGFIYNLMFNAFGRLSYDGEDAPMITVNNSPGISCPNANWNGVSANYCTGTAADDVVAHEWSHAYTEYTSQLIYAWQAGALNESYSDIWGETVDQLNNYMDAGESLDPRTGCGSSSRWQIGEKATAFGGALRDMWNPTCLGSPGKLSDPQYYCASSDVGGVHFNSGILNHAYALLVDGGTYNGQTINGLGLVKAAHIFWRAQTIYMTATTDFSAQADYLESALQDLIGADLQGLSTSSTPAGISDQVITTADAEELRKVILAVELRSEPGCSFQTLLKPAPALCEGANANLAIFSEDFESGLGGFIPSIVTLSDTYASKWISSTAPSGRTGKVAYGINYNADCSGAVNQTGIARLESPEITIPNGTAGNLNLVFDHNVSTETGWDGGNIKYSINNGNWTLLPATAFTANGYNLILNTAGTGSDNPFQGQPAFSGTDEGGRGSWGQSQINLTSLGLVAGNTIKFRWELGTDICGGLEGWALDNIRVYTCAVTPAVHFVVDKSIMNEGEATTVSGCLKYIDKIVTVQVDKAPTQPVTVTLNTPTGTAKMGSTADYTITPSAVTLQTGALTQNFTVRIYNDAYVEGNETINLSYSINTNGGNGYAASTFQNYELTIVDDDLTPGNYTEELLNTNFNNGTQGWTIINGGNDDATWQVVQYGNADLDPAGLPFLFANSTAVTSSATVMDEIAESPAVNTVGKKNMVLTFLQDWFPRSGGYADQGLVDIWDGTTWRNVLTQNAASGHLGSIFGTPNVKTINIPDAYANVNMKIRFRYMARYDNYWGIDNIKLTSSHSTDILTAVNSGNADQQYLGPNETAVFYDPATGNLMAKIKNLTDHDYGCTSVEIDRAGTDETAWVGSYKITKKTFKVTPTTNNANGKYEITLYYKAAELPNFNGGDITSMGKSAGGIGAGNVATSSFAEVQVSSAFNTDLAYTSTFTSGFSGFGLSDAPPVGPLPVTLTTFEGKNTAEGNLLNWATTTEVDNEYFAVERTADGKNFAEIGKVSGIGNSSVLNRYKFLDAASLKGTNYYRLKQVDRSGKFAYSRIISINSDLVKEIKFYPNPVQSLLTLELPDADVRSVKVQVINSLGQKVLIKNDVKVINGNFNLDVTKLAPGIYQVLLSGEKQTYNVSVFKL